LQHVRKNAILLLLSIRFILFCFVYIYILTGVQASEVCPNRLTKKKKKDENFLCILMVHP